MAKVAAGMMGKVMMIKRLLRLILIGILALLPSYKAYAQGENTILYGQTLNGQITTETFRIVYAFQGAGGEIIDAMLLRQRGDLDPALVLLSPAGKLLARTDDNDGYNAVLVSIALPQDGTYFLVATRFGGALGATTGTFSLTLQRVGVVSDPRLTTGGALPLRYGDSLVDTLDNSTPQRIYTFTALRGEIVSVRMQRVSGDLDPTLIFADAEGKVILINDEDPDRPGTLDAAITHFRIQRSGSYLIAATRFGGEAGTSRGAYNLSLERLSEDQIGLTPELAEALEYGAVVTGQITDDQFNRYYLITAQRGDVLTIEVVTTRGDTLDPALILLDSRLRSLVGHDFNSRGRSARITSYRVPADGAYVLVVSRSNRETGRTSGSYTLTVRAQ